MTQIIACTLELMMTLSMMHLMSVSGSERRKEGALEYTHTVTTELSAIFVFLRGTPE